MPKQFVSEITAENVAQVGQVQGNFNIGDNATVVIAEDEAKPAIPFLVPHRPLDYKFIMRPELLGQVKEALLKGESKAVARAMGIGKTALALQVANDQQIIDYFSDGVLWVHLGPQPDLRTELRRWASSLGVPLKKMATLIDEEDWQLAVANAIGLRRMLLVIDDVWNTEDAKPFLVGPNCAHLVTTHKLMVAADFSGEPVDIPRMTDQEGLELLACFSAKAVNNNLDAATKLVHAVGGLPFALVLLGKQLKKTQVLSPQSVPEMIRKLSDAKERLGLLEPLSAVIEISYQALDDDARKAIRALAIFRPNPYLFSRDVALLVSGATQETLDDLNLAGLLEAHESEFDKEQTYYATDQTITDYLRIKHATGQPAQLHHHAASYYRDKLRELEEKYQADPKTYSGWYRYENPEWQSLKDSWLFHVSHSGQSAAEIMLAFQRAYFDAFWWWGCYLEFRFCDQLIKEWEQRQSSDENIQMLALVREFQAKYPKETEEGRAGDWQRVGEILHALRKKVNLDSDDVSALAQEEERHVRGLTDIFLAEASRFGQGNREEAAKIYREACDLFTLDDDHWDKAWVLYHSADSDFERGQYAQALKQCAESMQLDKVNNDPEVVALVYRLQGDLALAQDDIAGAINNFQQALLQAYRFQVDPEPPDPYTVTFYSKMCQHVLKALQGINGESKIAAVSAIHNFWSPYWKSVIEQPLAPAPEKLMANKIPASELGRYLFPHELDKNDIEEQGEQYEALVKSVVNALEPALQCTPHC